ASQLCQSAPVTSTEVCRTEAHNTKFDIPTRAVRGDGEPEVEWYRRHGGIGSEEACISSGRRHPNEQTSTPARRPAPGWTAGRCPWRPCRARRRRGSPPSDP